MDLKEFGLIYQRKGKEKESRRYYPTRLALSLASGKVDSQYLNYFSNICKIVFREGICIVLS